MLKTICLPVLAALLHAPCLLSAQVRMESLTVADGLSQGFVTGMIQDWRGFIWMSTFDGLNRYDGYSVRRFSTQPFKPWSLQSSYTTCLYEDVQQLIWIGTHEGLCVFDPLTERFFSLNLSQHGLPANHVTHITGDNRGSIFVRIPMEANPLGLFRLSLPTDFAQRLRHAAAPLEGLRAEPVEAQVPLSYPVWVPECIGDTMLLAVDDNKQVFRFSYADQRLHPFDLRTLPSSPTADHNILWGKYTGCFFRWRLPDGRDTVLPLDPNPQAMRMADGKIGVWFTNQGPFLQKKTHLPLQSDFKLGPEHPPFQREFDQLLHPQMLRFGDALLDWRLGFSDVLLDRGDVLWLPTGGWGLRKVNLHQIAFGGLLRGRSIASLRELPDGRLWVRLYNNGSFVMNPATGQAEPAPWGVLGLYEVFADSKENCWLIQPRGGNISTFRLSFLEKSTGRRVRLTEYLPFLEGVPEKIFEDRNGNIWVAAHQGLLYRFRPGQLKAERFFYAPSATNNPLNLRSTAIAQDKNGLLWIGTNRGLIRVDSPLAAVPRLSFLKHDPSNLHSLSVDWVTSICQDPLSPDILWLGTRGGGLNRLDTRNNTFSYIGAEVNGLPDNVVYGILPDDDGNLWCSTNRGLCRFNPQRNTFVTYQESDGLLSTEFNANAYLRTRDGRLWFGGVSGLNVFRPSEIKATPRAPQVAITGIRVLGMPRLPDGEAHLSVSFEENNVLFEFAALDFCNPATNRYRHRLVGIDHDWVYDGTVHTANYSALPPGQYKFELQGATADGPWSEQMVVFHLTVRPPWYRSWLAWLMYVLAAGGAVLAYVRYREKIFRLQHSAELNQRESERLKAFDGVKNQFFANIAHELRTPLTVILGLAQRLRRGEKGDFVAQNAQNIIQQGEHLLDLSNQVLDLAKLESQQLTLHVSNGNVSDFIHDRAQLLAPLAASKGVQLSVDSGAAPQIWMDFDPAQLQKILNNLISNAIRHTPPGGQVWVQTALLNDGRQLHLQVSDTGEGIPPEDLPHIFDRFYQGSQPTQAVGASGIGLTLARDLTQLMGGSISAESPNPVSGSGVGSVFSVLLPITNQAPRMAEMPAQPPTLAPAPAPAASTDKRALPLLLIVEDNAAVLDYLRLCLYPHFRLATATDGNLGIEKALELVPDLVLTDVAMPEKDGFAVASILKNDVRTSHIPIVMLTAKAETADRMEGRRRGANAYLTKPFEEQELLLVLHNLLHLRQQWKHRYAPLSAQPSSSLDLAGHAPEDVRMEDEFMQKLYAVFEANYPDDGFNLERLCLLMGMSSSQLDRKLRVLSDQSPMQMLRTFRLQKARALLQADPNRSVKDVCFRTGFKNPSHFSRAFSEAFGVPPSEV